MYIKYSNQAARKAALNMGDTISFSLREDAIIQTGHIYARENGEVGVTVCGDGAKTMGKRYMLQDINLYRDSETDDPDILAPLRDVRGELDAENGEFNVIAIPNGSDEPLVVAQLALGTGYFIWASKAFYEFYGTDEGEKVVESMVKSCESHPIKLSSNVIAQLQRLSELNFLRRQLIKELTDELDARYDLSLDVNGLSPLENFSMDHLVQGEAKGDEHSRMLHCNGHRPARQNGADGIYCWQTVGYCEDDYSGEQFIHVGGNAYLCLPFEF